uniref:Uncharacterized protein n=1 Tax=Anguilla anguilla TaxID=7936 RepID=A0A0E9SUA2_ANGAN
MISFNFIHCSGLSKPFLKDYPLNVKTWRITALHWLHN